jgi:hypothetical protein
MSPSVTREWLSHQAASGYLEYEPATGKFTVPAAQAMVFAEPDSPVYLQGGFDIAASCWKGKTFTSCLLVGKDQDIVVIMEIGQFNNVIHPFGGRSCRMSPAGYMRLMGLPHHDEMI